MAFVTLLTPVKASATTLPPGFDERVIADVPHATGLAFAPGGRMMITTQEGLVWIHDGARLRGAPTLDISASVCSNAERGLLAVAVDPEFELNHFVYFFYTYKKGNGCDESATPQPVNRVSRFVLEDDGSIDLATEFVLLDNIPSPPIGVHNGADMHFGKDGYLYISIGDGGCDYRGDSECFAYNDAARDMSVLLGKVVRVTRDGEVPPDNPFMGTFTDTCRTTGPHPEGKTCREIFAFGLRNPFRMAFDPASPATRFYIGDVGDNNWEEIDLGIAGADYGWNFREGHCFRNSTTNCGPPPPGVTNPIFDYHHSTGCAGVIAGAFVPKSIWPSRYDGDFLYGDYVCGKVFLLEENADGTFSNTEFLSDMGYSTVGMRFGPHDGGTALYYITYPGEVRRVVFSGDANRSPVARAVARPAYGATPLTVELDATASSDPDANDLAYEWDFGDGTTATGAIVSHTYTEARDYTARVRVSDELGAVDTATVVISAGNFPPDVDIQTPSSSHRYQPGEMLTLSGQAHDVEDGDLADDRLRWTGVLHHNSHTHPYLLPTYGNDLRLQAPQHYDSSPGSTTYLEIRLEAVDSRGLETTATRDVWPVLETTLLSGPSGIVRSSGATFDFIANDPSASFECSLDSQEFVPCSAPRTYAQLLDRRHRFEVRAVDDDGNVDATPASRVWLSDATPPATPRLTVADGERFTTRNRISVSWSRTGATYDVRYVHAGPGTVKPNWKVLGHDTTSREVIVNGERGRTYCFSVRARDKAGNRSRWTDQTCVAIAMDDPVARIPRSQRHSWLRVPRDGFLGGAALVTFDRGAILVYRNVRHAERVALLVRTCGGCGAVSFWVRDPIRQKRRFISTTVLASADGSRRAFVAVELPRRFLSRAPGPVRFVARSAATRRLEVDAIAIENALW